MFLFQIVLVPFVDGNMEITVTKSSYQEKPLSLCVFRQWQTISSVTWPTLIIKRHSLWDVPKIQQYYSAKHCFGISEIWNLAEYYSSSLQVLLREWWGNFFLQEVLLWMTVLFQNQSWPLGFCLITTAQRAVLLKPKSIGDQHEGCKLQYSKYACVGLPGQHFSDVFILSLHR